MESNQEKGLKIRRAELMRQLDGLKGQRQDRPYLPGVTIYSGEASMPDEQTALQIEELQAAIAEIDEALCKAPGGGAANQA